MTCAERERKEEGERSSGGDGSSSEMFFMWKLRQDLTTTKKRRKKRKRKRKKGGGGGFPVTCSYTAGAHPQSRRRENTGYKDALLGLDQGDRHLREPALVTHLSPQIRPFC